MEALTPIIQTRLQMQRRGDTFLPYREKLLLSLILAMLGVFVGDETVAGPSVAVANSTPSPVHGPVATARDFEFRDEISRVVSLRKHTPIQITNSRGDITLIGWAQDKIRVKARRAVRSTDSAEVRRLLRAADFSVRTAEGWTEVIAEYGAGLTLEERIRERANPRASMELTVYAPADLPLRIWAADGKVVLKDWRSTVEVRSRFGQVQISGVRGDSVSILCPSCQMTVETVRGSLRCMGGEGAIHLRDVVGPQIYTESLSGAVSASRIEGEQLYVSRTGNVQLRDVRGRIEFNLQQGDFEIENGSGFLSGKTVAGRVVARMREWSFADKALIETATGDVSLTLPADFSAELDLRSRMGAVTSDFNIRHSSERKTNASPIATAQRASEQASNSLGGWVGAGGEVLRIFSDKGSISLKAAAQ